jgi:hypothetical protein
VVETIKNTRQPCFVKRAHIRYGVNWIDLYLRTG